MKDHEIAALVNTLRDIAIKYHGSQQLREQIAAVVVPALRGARGPAKTVDSVIAALQQSSSGITAGAEKPSQVVDSGAAGPTRTGDLLITNQGAETAETLGNQQDTPTPAPAEGAKVAQCESITCEGVTAGLRPPADRINELMPTHFCLTCGARWRQLDDGRWNLRSPRCEPCCDNGPAFNLMPLVMAYDALRGQLHDEIAANHAFRDAGGALPYEDMPTFCDRLIRERAALEAEKAERERQEPVAWAWDDALGCMHVHCGSRRPVWVDGECSDATRAEMKLRPLYARPLPARSDRDCAHYTFVGWLGPRGIFMEDEIYQAWKEHRKDPSAAQYRKVFAAEGDIQ